MLKNYNLLIVGQSPQTKSALTTRRVMLNVIIALLPALVLGIVFFKTKAFVLILGCVLACVLFELLFNMITRSQKTATDLSAVVTGLLLAMNLSVETPLWVAVIGCFFAIVIVKMLFGGIGKNIVNPALAARVFLLLCFTSLMTAFTDPAHLADAGTAATSLLQINAGKIAGLNLGKLFVGFHAGTIGETSSLALLVGGGYLLATRTIDYKIPLIFLGSAALFALLFTSFNFAVVPYHLFSGGLMLGAIFMATDYSTSPRTNLGKIIFAFGCGLLTMTMRIYGSWAEGVSFAILFMNFTVPLLNKIGNPRPFGKVKNPTAKTVPAPVSAPAPSVPVSTAAPEVTSKTKAPAKRRAAK